MNLIRKYYLLTKPGIVYGNLIAAVAGFMLASKTHINYIIFISLLLGISFIIASACVANNYIDRKIDDKMARTKKRSLLTGSISLRNAIIYSSLLCVLGFLILYINTNILTVLIGFVGYFSYIVLYGIAKRRTIYGTIIGSIPGALPPVAGYTAVTNRIDAGAMILFLILVFWQMPHFYSIAMYRLKDYKSASLPVWPVKKGIYSTKIQILLFVVAFIIASFMLFIFKYTGYIYLFALILVCIIWVWFSIEGFKTKDDLKWARKMFIFSLFSLLSICILISFNSVVRI